MLAVIATGGKQYIVKPEQILKVEKIEGEVGDILQFDTVLLLSDDEGQTVNIGTPIVEGAKVEAEIIEQGRSKKIRVVKYKPKVRYKKVYGHRQHFTKVKITSIK